MNLVFIKDKIKNIYIDTDIWSLSNKYKLTVLDITLLAFMNI